MNSDESEWTTSRWKDECFQGLVRAPDNKYYEQAKALMFRIPLTEQYPNTEEEAVPYTIYFSDLSSRVQAEFIKLCKVYRKEKVSLLLKEVVAKLFENLDYEYTHKSIMRKLRVKMVKS